MVLIYTVSLAQTEYHIKATHSRLFSEDVKELAGRCDDPHGRKTSDKPPATSVQTERQYNES